MLQRISMWYLWLLPLSFMVLREVFHPFAMTVAVVVGLVYLATVALVIAENLPSKGGTGGLSTATLAGVILIAGGAVVWLCGSAGPPDFSHPPAALFNNGGLITGHVIVLAGFAMLTASLWDVANRSLCLLGLVSYTLSAGFWISAGVHWWAFVLSPLRDAGVAGEKPEWLKYGFDIAYGFGAVYKVTAYFGTAAFGGAMWNCGWVGKGWGIIFVIASLGVATPAAARVIPFAAPALAYVLPYFMGVLLLRRSAGHPSHLASPGPIVARI